MSVDTVSHLYVADTAGKGHQQAWKLHKPKAIVKELQKFAESHKQLRKIAKKTEKNCGGGIANRQPP